MSPGIVLASATSPTEQAVFDELVYRGIERDRVSEFHPQTDDRMVHAWPVPDEDDIDPTDIHAGDYVLFYRGSNRYTWATRVQRVDRDADLAGTLSSHVARRSGNDTNPHQEFGSTVLWFEIPVPIELQSYRLHDLLDIGQDALTRTILPSSTAVQALVDEYGSLEDMVRTHREDPRVFIEMTSLEDKPYKQPDGEFELGTAAFSPSSSTQGHDIYGTLREPEVGDLIVHILKDSREVRGVSVVSSPLQTDFDGPPDGSWEPADRGEGYFLPLGGYTEFEEPAHLDDDLLRNDDYKERLQTIYETNEGLFYDKNFELSQGKYFTESPIALLYLILAEEPSLLSFARRDYWNIEQPDAAGEYDTVSQAVVDVRTRLPFATANRDWFLDAFTQTVVEAFTDSLSSVQPNAELTQTEATHCEIIRQLYLDREETLADAADRLGVGRTNQVDGSQTLFFVLFRELQRAAGVSANMNQVKTRTILQESYKVESPTIEFIADEKGPLESKPKPEQGDEIARQLADIGQMVFYGPPGTGKTYTAKRFAHWWLNEQPGVDPHTGQLETVTFHPSFTYEDFIEGLSVDTDSDGAVTYDEEPGVFLEFAKEARRAYHATDGAEEAPRYILIVDEINRGNLAQIFGEMITALEADKRLDGDNETIVSLAHSGDQFRIPPNLYLIGTMNTADRSIALVDAALRRRFRFLSFPPKLRLLREEHELGNWHDVADMATQQTHPDNLLSQSLIAIYELNVRIRSEPDLGRGKQIGHSFLFDLETDEEIVDTWRFEILPLLEEYLFGQYTRIREALFVGDGRELFDWEREQIRSFEAPELSSALEPFVVEFDPSEATADD